MFTDTDYRNILKSRLVERISANPQYSLRAFARDLDSHPSRISEILSGKQGLSLLAAKKFCQRLEFSAEQTNYFCDLVLSQDSRSKNEREAALLRLQKRSLRSQQFHVLAEDAFKVISDWYHFAIVDLLRIPKAKSDVTWIAKKLEISDVQAQSALQRLLRLELIKLKNKCYVPTDSLLLTTFDIPSDAQKSFHQQIIAKALKALTIQSVDEREFITATLAVPESKIKIVKDKIRQFNKEIVQLTESSIEPTSEVYALSTQFFRLTHKEK